MALSQIRPIKHSYFGHQVSLNNTLTFVRNSIHYTHQIG